MEIEVKARLVNRATVLQKLTELGCKFSEPAKQDDTVWVAKVETLDEFLSNDFFVRVRIQNDSKVFLTVKKPKAKIGHESLIKHEYEVVVDSAEEVTGMLGLMNLKPAVQIIKKRIKAKYKDYEICIDEIDNLGTFIEIEKIGESSTARQVQGEMMDFLITLGVSGEAVVKKGYDILMIEKNTND